MELRSARPVELDRDGVGGLLSAEATSAHLAALAARVNAAELAQRRDYYEHLTRTQGVQDESFEEHVARYASLATVGPPADAREVDTLRALWAAPLPAELDAFYRVVGGFSGGERLARLTLPAPRELLAWHAPGAPRWQALESIGLVAMMRRSWGNDRPELEPETGEGLDAEQVAALDARYGAIGWRTMPDEEAFEYLWFDRDGRFGVLFYHQDDFESLWSDALAPMLEASPARLALHEAILAMLDFSRWRA